ncbi:L-xylulose reductase [Roseibium sp. TrichSKD4]|uniref:SDR family NAD(P)-dependent oxidoreductase n=1 Tax=Roseibium sp. TrichSKD4 TaxID=744980 RepID=UPI0001E561C5|nr:SDR family oxidoreductase [Roseibium sp. TrichSKD4]EFO32917.1 L-xylulose reductase [Roseibium sp. TrichSKD4]
MIDLPSTPSFSLKGKKVLVAGASSGIGLACASALAEAGGDVVLAARRADKLSDAVSAMTAKGWTASALQLDIVDVEAVQAAVAEHGPFDVLVNSAGLARHSPAVETTLEDYDAVMAINVRGAYFLAQAVAKGLMEAGKPGSLITISSQMAHVGGIDRAVYCASKFAVEGFTKAMALEFGPKKIRINTICPTFIRTPLTEPTFENPERVKWIEEKIKLGRTGVVEDIMGSVLYLASDASSLVTGTSLLVDGGWTAD